MKSPEAIARDKFMLSEDATRLSDAYSLGAPASANQYLRNRIEKAFLAGLEAGMKLPRRKQPRAGEEAGR